MATTTSKQTSAAPTGPAAAAMISSSIGIFFIGFFTTAAGIIPGLGSFLNWWNPAGNLTGKTGLSIIIWLISWAVMNNKWKNENYDLGKAFNITVALIVLGLLLTFPPIFQIFE